VGDVPVTRRAYKDICLRLSINYSDVHSSQLVEHDSVTKWLKR